MVLPVQNALEPAVGEVVGEKYRIDRFLGRGGMGVVYAATHVLTGRGVALKWMHADVARDPEARERFLREAQAAGRVQHPNVVAVHDVGSDERGTFLVMELLEGQPLSSALAHGPVAPAVLLSFILPALRGVAAAHRSGVVHRDLKPDNIFLAAQPDGAPPVPKVLDFGISKVATSEPVELTHSGCVMGTPRFMPPEQFKGAKHSDHRVDIYAAGVILYRGLTGRFPYSAETYGAMAIEVATATAAPPSSLVPGIDPRLEAVVLRAMARDPDARFGTMDELTDALAVFVDAPAGTLPPHLAGLPLIAPSPEIARTVRKPLTGTPAEPAAAIDGSAQPRPRRRLVFAMAAVFVGALLVGLLGANLLARRGAGARDPSRVPEAASPLAPPVASRSAQPTVEVAPPSLPAAETPAPETPAAEAPAAARAEAPAPTPTDPAPPPPPMTARASETPTLPAARAGSGRMRPARARARESGAARGASERRTGSLSLDDF
jgi:serine/threonine-protein kinase